jgi:hypothetical protein
MVKKKFYSPWGIEGLTPSEQICCRPDCSKPLRVNDNLFQISAWNMELTWAWNISLNHNLVADMFMGMKTSHRV